MVGEEKKIFSGWHKNLLAALVIKTLYCRAAELLHCQYVSCGEVGFAQ